MDKVKIDKIPGSRRLSNYWWASVILLGGLSFFIVGITSYIKLKLGITVIDLAIGFMPQGAVMTFYGMTGILISSFLWYTIVFDVGSGYNEFNNISETITIFRFGFPGKNRLLKLTYKLQEISAIKIRIQDGLSPKREIYLKTKDKREIPLTKIGEPISIQETEKQAKEIASFLKVKLEGIQ